MHGSHISSPLGRVFLCRRSAGGEGEHMVASEQVERATETPMKGASSRPLAATLMLTDGTCFYGRGAGIEGLASGEMVFTTAMTGYQEALTDPSYRGQLLMFTYPLIGNYGVAAGRAQSDLLQASGVIVATLSDAGVDQPSLGSYLARHAVPTMHGVDTR